MNVEYELHGESLKENIIITRADAATNFVFDFGDSKFSAPTLPKRVLLP